MPNCNLRNHCGSDRITLSASLSQAMSRMTFGWTPIMAPRYRFRTIEFAFPLAASLV
jgi:hypothetical protein